jgi:hypothetical protein
MSKCENNSENKFNLSVSETTGKCGVGEKIGDESVKQKKIPVLSCDGACIRGEIARLAANYVSKNEKYQRGCHGELFTVPNSSIANWIKTAEKVVCIDGCFLKCHSRIMENIIDPLKLLVFDALSYYKKFNDIFEIDDVPEEERKTIARNVSLIILEIVDQNKKIETGNSSCSG